MLKTQLTFILLGFFMSEELIAKTVSNDEKQYVGGYTQQTNETVSRIILFDDNKFCFTFMGGSSDVLSVGDWKKEGKGISIKEKREVAEPFGMLAERNPELKNEVRIRFDGYSMSEATSAVFAVTESDLPPKTFKRLFDENQSSWRMEYILPNMPQKVARYLYVGFVEEDEYRQPRKLRVFQFKVGEENDLRIGFNMAAIRTPIDIKATLEDDVLKIASETFGRRNVLSKEVFEEARRACLEQTQQTSEQFKNIKNPVKELTLALSAIEKGHHEFVKESPNAFKFHDWTYLKPEYDKAKKDKKDLPDYFNVANGLMERNKDLKEHAGELISFSNELVNKYSQTPGASDALVQVVEHFIEKIYPKIVVYKSQPEIQKGIDILTSNSLGNAINLKHDHLRKKIYDRILGGPNFDLKKIEHGTLLYNLACDYALHKEKPRMLEAIKLAIVKGNKPESFKQETDFSAYHDDVDFLKIVGP
jgi:hypothetical protein